MSDKEIESVIDKLVSLSPYLGSVIYLKPQTFYRIKNYFDRTSLVAPLLLSTMTTATGKIGFKLAGIQCLIDDE